MKFIADKISYKVNEERRTVVAIMACKITGCSPIYRETFNVTGIAKCNPNDPWNEDIGKKIATARAYQRMYLETERRIKRYMKPLHSCLYRLQEAATKAHKCSESERESINRLMNLI
jgi:aspartate/glutamate racemase